MHLINIVAILGVVAMVLSAIPKHIFKYGLETAWLLIFAFLAVRYDFGNDYMSYFDGFTWGESFSNELDIDTETHNEPGWQMLCQLFKPLGFFVFVAVLTAFECFVFYRFVKEYVPEGYYWLAIFLFVFTPSIMLIGSSAMRQMLAIAIFVNSIKYLRGRRLIPYLISIFLATQFHSSAVILYPLYLLSFYQDKSASIKTNSLIIIAFFILSLSSKHMMNIIEYVASFAGEEESMDYYLENAVFQEGGSGFGYIVQIAIFCYLVLTLHMRDPKNRVLFLILMLSTFIIPFASVIPMMGRFSFFFGACGVACYPIILKDDVVNNPNGLNFRKVSSIFVLSMVVVLTIYEYITFFMSPVWIEKFSAYHTIFEVL